MSKLWNRQLACRNCEPSMKRVEKTNLNLKIIFDDLSNNFVLLISDVNAEVLRELQ
jgi:hypothetical protein